MLQPVSPTAPYSVAPYNVSVQLEFSSPKLEDSIFGASELDLINGRDKGGHFCATNTNSTDNRGYRSRAKIRRCKGRSVTLCVNGIFSCEISIPPSGHCRSGFCATLLWYLLVGDFTPEKSQWQQNHFASMKTMSVLKIQEFLRQDSNLITARNKIHPRWKCPLLELKSVSEWLFFPLCFWS